MTKRGFMRKQLQADTIAFLDTIIQLLDGFKHNEIVNIKNDDQLALIDNHVALLNEEKEKVSQRELVIAVVGTMKAGKSTTINSIVGREILPNRNEAMTSLPTLITHVNGNIEPTLSFPCTEPVNQLIYQLRERLSSNTPLTNSPETTQLRRPTFGFHARPTVVAAPTPPSASRLVDAEQFERIKHRFAEIIDHINDGWLFKPTYVGQEAIFDFLKVLNDIVRLADSLQVSFPYDAYSQLANLPRIEVEFSTLNRYEACEDKLTLLDTPGPNEAGQNHFKSMLDEQLTKSSAVITVIDYTQLNSTSEYELRQTILSLKDTFSSVGQSIPVYALVNKFDNRDENSLDEVGVKQRVGEELFEGTLESDNVLPYCARDAFRANLGLHALENNIEFRPEYPWVKNIQGSIGHRTWDLLVRQPDALRAHFEDQLDASLFHQVIETCVVANYRNVLPQVLQSAVNKALLALNDVKNPLNVLYQSIEADAEHIESMIERVKRGLVEFESARLNFDAALEAKMTKVKSRVRTSISRETQTINLKWDAFKGHVIDNYAERTYEKKEQVTAANQKITENALININDMRRSACNNIETSFDDIKEELALYTKENIDTIKDKIFDELKDNGIDVDDWKPTLTQVGLNEPISMETPLVLKTKQIASIKRRRQENAWGSLCGLFDSTDWGWEEYTHYDDVFVVDYRQLLGSFDKLIQDIPQELAREASDIFEIDIKRSFQEYHTIIADRINQISDNMTQSVALNQGEVEAIHQAKQNIADLSAQITDCLAKAEIIKDAIKAM